MAYFPHAFQKLLVGTNGFPTDIAGDNTLAVTAGKIAVVSAKTHLVQDITAAPTYAATPLVYLAQGSFAASDKLGPFHGGYKETVKTKGINPKYVHKFYVTEPGDSQNQVLTVKAAEGDILPQDKTFLLRLDIKGSSALRFATRNLYKTLDAFTGCASDPAVKVEATVVLEQWRDQINTDPFLKEFVTAAVSTVTGDPDPTKNGHFLTITVTYADTQFSDESWTQLDHFEKEPLQLYASALLQDEGDPCETNMFSISETQEGRQGKGYGEPLLKELILTKRYRQEPFKDDHRTREILGDTTMSELSRGAKYYVYHILHSVPRHANPSSQLDADQYLIKIVVNARDNNFETYLNTLLTSAGSAVQLEVVA